MYIRNVHLTTKELCIRLLYGELLCFGNIIYTYITVNFYWSELDTSSGQIYCTLDILDIVHSYNRE